MRFRKLLLRTLIFSTFLHCSVGWDLETTRGSTHSRTFYQDQNQAVEIGVELEASRHWLDAMEHYEGAVKRWPESNDLRYGLRRSKIHFGIERRYSDKSFRSSLLRKSRREAMIVFEEVFAKIRSHFVDNVTPTSFVAHGTESLYLALANDKFLKQHLATTDRNRIRRMRRILREEYWNKWVANSAAAGQTVIEVCDLAQSILGLPSATVIMEYIFGGCNSLDDYSNCLTPDRLDDLYDNIDGEFVGLGIEMKAEMGKGMLMVKVLPESPAAEGGVRFGDHIVSINGTNCRNMTTDEAASLLRGPVGSRVVLVLSPSTKSTVRRSTLTRRPVQVKSIPVAEIVDRQYGIGYIKMTGFQKTSASELDAALKKLRSQQMRFLIWDLRGNPGGLLTAAVEVLDRFVDHGVLVSTRGRTQDQNWSYSAHRPGTFHVPLVLLTDGESASASEIVAGAIRDHRRGTIVGRQTYGKWSVQSIFPIRGTTGLRLTTAKFYSPHDHTLGGIGVSPDYIVEDAEPSSDVLRGSSRGIDDDDPDIQKGLEIIRKQISRG